MKTTVFTLFMAVLVWMLPIAGLRAQGPYDGKRNTSLAILSGKITSDEGEVMDFVTVYLKNSSLGGVTNADGVYHIKAPAGRYTLVASAVGYETLEKTVLLEDGKREIIDLSMSPDVQQLDEVTIVSTGVSRVRRSAFNAVAVDAKDLQNTTKNLSEALAKAPGMKLRESGGVGSDMQLMLDGFSGKHVKVFIDGIPQEGTGSSFGLNNIPVSFAERIEVYKGVVPVGFGTDGPSKPLSEFYLHIGYHHSFNVILQGGVLLPFRFAQWVRDGERQPHNNQRRHHISGKVHPFPAGTRCEQHSVLSLLEAMDDILRMPPDLH